MSNGSAHYDNGNAGTIKLSKERRENGGKSSRVFSSLFCEKKNDNYCFNTQAV